MYSEEATEVWFNDYGFAQLKDGEVWVSFDELFAEMANVGEAYHVFLQAYGPAELFVSERTAAGFRVKLRNGESNAEFSYRIVARRAGFENERMNPAQPVSGGR
jgi:hypothetical protein